MNDYEKDAINLFDGLEISNIGLEDIDENGLSDIDSKEWEFDASDLGDIGALELSEDSIQEGTYVQPKKEKFLGIITIQAILCVGVLIVLILTKVISTEAGTAVREQYIRLYTKDVNWAELYTIYSERFNSFIDQFTPIQNTEDESGQEPESSVGEEHPESSQETSDDTNQNSQNEPSEANEDTGISQIGGELQVQYPPEGASFAPVVYFGTAVFPAQGTISSYFGFREDPLTGESSFHKGIDIAAEEGTTIVAMSSGTVAIAESSNSYGEYIILDHGYQFSTLYAHCSKLLVNSGDSVSKGQAIAEVGSTGRVNGSHLHFEVIKNNLRVDPAWLLPEVRNG